MMRCLLFIVWVNFTCAYCFSETLLVANKSANSVSFLDLTQGQVVAKVSTGDSPHEIATVSQGQFAVVANYGSQLNPGNTLTVIDVAQAKSIKTIDLGSYTRPHGIECFKTQPRCVVTVEGAQAVCLVNIDTATVDYCLNTGQSKSHMVSLSPDEKHLAIANMDSGSVTVLAVDRTANARSVATGEGAEGISFSRNGQEIWVAHRSEDSLTILDSPSLTIKNTLVTGTFPIRLEMTANGQYALVTNARSGEIGVYDVAKQSLVKQIKLAVNEQKVGFFTRWFVKGSIPIGIQPHPTKNLIYIAHAGSDSVCEFSLDTFTVKRVFDAGPEPDGMAFSSVTPIQENP